jgi:hydrogenase maturation protein HypF
MRRLTVSLWRAVQGAGIRPLVARIAAELGLVGSVQNTPRCVSIVLEGPRPALARFTERLRAEGPASLELLATESEATGEYASFSIAESDLSGPCSTDALAPDTRVCDACMREHDERTDRRAGWALISCAQCGPRFTITTALPFDRDRTTMAPFALCELCVREYRSTTDRRSHAQAIACPNCGPDVRYEDRSGSIVARGRAAIELAIARLRAGEIIALEGLGGFQLLCDATRSSAVRLLRERKRRPEQPFAVLVADVRAASELARVDPSEARALLHASGSIVLLRARGSAIAPEVAPRLARVGVMLPTSAAHATIARAMAVPIVCTSGNLHEDPIVIDRTEALERLASIADGLVLHDRAIARRADDSVVQVVSGRTRVLRAGRGLAPMTFEVGGVDRLCAGGHYRAAPALVVDGRATLWPHVGDLDGPSARSAYDDAVRSMELLSKRSPLEFVCDAHPDYASSIAAEARARVERRPIRRVLHHHAHVGAVLAEHGHSASADVLGFAWDGTGLGPEADIAGGEALLVGDAGARWRWRMLPFALPGGDAASRDTRRSLAGALVACELPVDASLERFARLAGSSSARVRTSSVGRLFDAVACALGLRERSSYEGHAAMELEAIADPSADEPFPFELDGRFIDWRPTLRAIVRERRTSDPAVIAGRFHHTLAAIVGAVCAREDTSTVALAGGCFANALLLERCEATIERARRTVLSAERIPSGDGGLALGQAWVSATAARGMLDGVWRKSDVSGSPR